MILTGLWLVFASLNSAAFATPSPDTSFWAAFWHEYAMCTAYWATWGPGTMLVILWSSRYQISRQTAKSTVLRHLALGILLSEVQTAFYFFVSPLIQIFFCDCSYGDVISTYSPVRIFLGWRLLYGQLIYWGIVGAEHSIRHYRNEQEQRLRSARLEAQAATIRLESLASRLHPHFLFNSFHTIVSLIETGYPDQARDMAVGLSDLLQRSLSNETAQMLPLRDEIEFIEAYLKLEKVRFSDRLSVGIHVDPEAGSARVPRFMLQPLAENAIRYGVSQSLEPCHIELRAVRIGDQIQIELENDGPPITPTETGSGGLGIGLRLTRERLDLIYGDRHKFELTLGAKGGAKVVITLPIEDFEPGISHDSK